MFSLCIFLNGPKWILGGISECSARSAGRLYYSPWTTAKEKVSRHHQQGFCLHARSRNVGIRPIIAAPMFHVFRKHQGRKTDEARKGRNQGPGF
jgi:hypothetical protein